MSIIASQDIGNRILNKFLKTKKIKKTFVEGTIPLQKAKSFSSLPPFGRKQERETRER